MANEHRHSHGHTLTHAHGEHGEHEHRFSHSHLHQHGDDGTNEHGEHEHLEVGNIFAHSEHHLDADAPSAMVAPGEQPTEDESMNKPGEPSKSTMVPPGAETPKSRSLWWGE